MYFLLPVLPPAPSGVLDTEHMKLMGESVANSDLSSQIPDSLQQGRLRHIKPGRRWVEVNTYCM